MDIKKFKYLLILIIFAVLTLLFFSQNYLLKQFFFLFNSINYNSTENLLLFTIITFIYLLTPLPADIIILFNGFIWGLNGFFVSYPLLILNSLILFFLSKKIIKIYKFKIHKHRVLKKIKSKVNSSNYKVDYAIFLSRYLVPFFFHNIFFGIFSKKFWKFLFLIILAEIPYTYALISIGSSLNMNIKNNYFSFTSLMADKSFVIPLFLVLIILIISKIKLK